MKIDLLLTNVLFTKMLSKQFAVFCGKLDTFDGDSNAFASGRGKTQFSNTAFVVNPIAFRTVPYSTLGCGFSILGEEGTPIFSYTLLNAVDTADKAGFDELFAEGVAMAAELRLPTRLRWSTRPPTFWSYLEQSRLHFIRTRSSYCAPQYSYQSNKWLVVCLLEFRSVCVCRPLRS